MKKLIIIAAAVACLCGCGKSKQELESEKALLQQCLKNSDEAFANYTNACCKVETQREVVKNIEEELEYTEYVDKRQELKNILRAERHSLERAEYTASSYREDWKKWLNRIAKIDPKFAETWEYSYTYNSRWK